MMSPGTLAVSAAPNVDAEVSSYCQTESMPSSISLVMGRLGRGNRHASTRDPGESSLTNFLSKSTIYTPGGTPKKQSVRGKGGNATRGSLLCSSGPTLEPPESPMHPQRGGLTIPSTPKMTTVRYGERSVFHKSATSNLARWWRPVIRARNLAHR